MAPLISNIFPSASLNHDTLNSYLANSTLAARTRNTITDKHKPMQALEQVRRDRWALGDQEYKVGVRSVSGPLNDRNGKVIAALKIVAPASQAMKDVMLKQFLLVLQRAVGQANPALRSSK